MATLCYLSTNVSTARQCAENNHIQREGLPDMVALLFAFVELCSAMSTLCHLQWKDSTARDWTQITKSSRRDVACLLAS